MTIAIHALDEHGQSRGAAEKVAGVPALQDGPGQHADRVFQHLADDLAVTTYHQNFFDQDLGPSVGRVINDISVAVAAGEMR